jgi:hypothetical protein
MARLILSFDTEDFVTPESDDALLMLTTELTQRGLRGNFALVGDKLRALLQRGRRDVIAALAAHELDYHSNDHHFFPLQAPLLESLPWDEGLAWVLDHEARGVELIEQTCGVRPVAYIKADSHWTPPTLCAYRRLGMTVYSSRHFATADPQPYRYMNLQCLPYAGMLDGFIARDGTPKRLADAALTEVQGKLAAAGEHPVVYGTHPCMWVCEKFYDVHNVKRRGRPPARAKWQPAPLLPPERIERNRRFLRRFLDGLLAAGVECTCYADACAGGRADPFGPDAAGLATLCRQVRERFGATRVEGRIFSAAELLAMLCWVVARHEGGTCPDSPPVRRPLGPVTTPRTLEAPLPVCARALQGAAQYADEHIAHTGHIPAGVDVGGHHFPPGPLLMALAEGVLRLHEGKKLGCSPLAVMADCPDEQALLEGQRIGAWALPPDYRPARLLELGRLQSWTLAPVV